MPEIKIDSRKVKQLMAERKIDSIRALAEAANLHPNTVYNVMDSEKFDSKTLARLAAALRCQPQDLLTWSGFAPEPFSLAPVGL